MTILVDTNLLPRSRDLDSLEIQLLLAIGRETGHDVTLPDLVVEEAVGQRRREIEEGFDKLFAAHKAARQYAAIPPLPELPIPGEIAREYEGDLRNRFTVEPLPANAAQEALRREVHRLRPARDGTGARDVAIWLTVKEVHSATEGPTYFLSANVKDFAASDGWSLHKDLREEIDALGGEFSYCRSVADLLEQLADETEPFVNVTYLNDHDQTVRAAVLAIRHPDVLAQFEVPRDLDVPKRTPLYPAGPMTATATDVSEARGFSVEGRQVTVAWTRWEASFTAGVTLFSHAGAAQLKADMTCQAALQMLVRSQKDGEESIEADVLTVRGAKVSPT